MFDWMVHDNLWFMVLASLGSKRAISSEGLMIKGFRSMITKQDLYNILGNKISNEMQKAIIRNNCPPQIAERKCAAIGGQEKAEHFQRLLEEYSKWLVNQQRQQMAIQEF